MDKQKLEMIFTGVERAVDDFETEYNHLPHIGSSYPATTSNVQTGDAGTIIGKDFNGSATMTQFFTVLSSPLGAVASCNFKKIKFFETAQAKGGPGNYSNGLVDNGNGTVTLYDPYGFEFTFARVDYNMDGILGRPGQLTTASANISGKKIVLLSWGPDGQFTGGGATQPQNLDNVISWVE